MIIFDQAKRQKARAQRLRIKLRKQEERIIAKEAKQFAQQMIYCLARLGAMYAARWRYDTGPDAGSRRKRKKTQYVQFERCFMSRELIHYKVKVRARTLWGFKDKLPHMTTVAQLINDQALFELSMSVERKVTAKTDPRTGAWIIVHRLEGIDGLPRLVNFRDILEHLEPDEVSRKGQMLIGIGENRVPIYVSLARQPHGLIAGASGGGKSNCINAILAAIIRNAHPKDLRLILIDLKRVEFAFYKDTPHLYMPVIVEIEPAIEVLKKMLGIIRERTALIEGKSKEISDWNYKHPDHQLPRLLVVIDEFAELTIATDKETRIEVLKLVSRISALGRAVGVHLFIATQRPAVEVVPNQIKINMDVIVCFRVQSKTQSATIINNGAAADLPLLPGRALLLTGSELRQLQTPLVSQEDIAEAIGIAKGRMKGIIDLNGPDPYIVKQSFIHDILANLDGYLAVDQLSDYYRAYGITRAMVIAFLRELAVMGGMNTFAGYYKVEKEGKRRRLVKDDSYVPPEPIETPEKQPDIEPMITIDPIKPDDQTKDIVPVPRELAFPPEYQSRMIEMARKKLKENGH